MIIRKIDQGLETEVGREKEANLEIGGRGDRGQEMEEGRNLQEEDGRGREEDLLDRGPERGEGGGLRREVEGQGPRREVVRKGDVGREVR